MGLTLYIKKGNMSLVSNIWECIFYSFSSNQRGVAIIINKHFEYKIITKNKKDDSWNLLT
jgi:hypothetical protein